MDILDIRVGMKVPSEFIVSGSSRVVFAKYTDHGDRGDFDMRVEGPRGVVDQEATEVAQDCFRSGPSTTAFEGLREWLLTHRPGDPPLKSAFSRLDEEWF